MEKDELASESMATGEPKPKRSSQSKSKIKTVQTVSFDYRTVDDYVMIMFLPTSMTDTKVYCLEAMRLLLEDTGRK